MENNVNDLRATFSSKIENAKEKLNETKNRIHDYMNGATEKARDTIEARRAEVNAKLEENQKLLIEKKEEVEASIANFKEQRNLKAAQKKAEKSKEYAATCIALTIAIIEEADIAINNAVIAEQELQEIAK